MKAQIIFILSLVAIVKALPFGEPDKVATGGSDTTVQEYPATKRDEEEVRILDYPVKWNRDEDKVRVLDYPVKWNRDEDKVRVLDYPVKWNRDEDKVRVLDYPVKWNRDEKTIQE